MTSVIELNGCRAIVNHHLPRETGLEWFDLRSVPALNRDLKKRQEIKPRIRVETVTVIKEDLMLQEL